MGFVAGAGREDRTERRDGTARFMSRGERGTTLERGGGAGSGGGGDDGGGAKGAASLNCVEPLRKPW